MKFTEKYFRFVLKPARTSLYELPVRNGKHIKKKFFRRTVMEMKTIPE